MDRIELATELMRGCPDENWTDHNRIAVAIKTGKTKTEILNMPEMGLYPETYVWLKNNLG